MALLGLVVVAGACGGDTGDDAPADEAAPTTEATPAEEAAFAEGQDDVFVGTVEGTDAYVAVRSNGNEVVAYVCDGDELVAYLSGSRDGSSLTAEEPGDLVSLKGELDGASVTGTVTTPDGDHRFTAEPAEGDAGYFRAEVRDGDNVTVGGWIRLDDGSVRGKVRRTTIVGEPAPPPGDDELGDGTSVPDDAQPAGFIDQVKCGVASFKLFRAKQALDNPPTVQQHNNVIDATRAANAACGIPGGPATDE